MHCAPRPSAPRATTHTGIVIGHPVVRGWYERHSVAPGRARVDDEDVRQLLSQVAPSTTWVDLGGEDSLNLLLEGQDVVFRVRRPFVSRRRLLGEQLLKRHLVDAGLATPDPITWRRRTVLRCGPRWAQLERYVPPGRPPDGTATDEWLFAALGRLHRAMATVTSIPPRPLVSNCVSPRAMRRWLDANCVARQATEEHLDRLVRMLRSQWVPAKRLPQQLIHGDVHAGNILPTASGEPLYLDLGGATVAPRIHDVGYALAHLVFAHCTDGPPNAASFPWYRLPRLLSTYESAAKSRLTADERTALPAYTAAVPIYYDICDWSPRPVSAIAQWILEHRFETRVG